MSSLREEDRRERQERRIDIIRRQRRRRLLQAAGIALVALLGLRAWVGRPAAHDRRDAAIAARNLGDRERALR